MDLKQQNILGIYFCHTLSWEGDIYTNRLGVTLGIITMVKKGNVGDEIFDDRFTCSVFGNLSNGFIYTAT